MMNQSDAAWAHRRAQVLLAPNVTQLNAGTCSPTPKPIFERVSELRRKQAESPTEFQWRDSWSLFQKSREALSLYLNCNSRDLALLENVTVALNIAAHGLSLPAGSEILISNHEYGSIIGLWYRLAEARGWTVKPVSLPAQIEDPSQIVDAFTRAATDQSKVLSFSHVSSPSGLIFPAFDLCNWARQRELITVIDAAHAPGHVPVDLKDLDADFYCANCHKWMMAPASAGFIHAGPRVKHLAKSVVSSWGHVSSAKEIDDEVFPGTTRWQYDLEFHGTTDRCPQMVLPDTIAFRQSIGGDGAVRQRVGELTHHLRAKLAEIGLRAFLPQDARLVGTMTAFVLPEDFQKGGGFIASPSDSPAQRLQKRLWEKYRIECPTTFADDSVFLRVSTAWFNTSEEIDRLAAAVRETLAG